MQTKRMPRGRTIVTYGVALGVAASLVLGLTGCTQSSGDGAASKPSAAASPAAKAATTKRKKTTTASKPATAKPKATAARTTATRPATTAATPKPAVQAVSYPSMTTGDDRGQ